MSVPTAHSAAPAARADDQVTTEDSTRRTPPSIPHFYGWLVGVALVVATLSLLFPSTPSYDPWAWLVWGREIAHLNLHTPGGPTWKPLPVVFTTVFSVFGSAQPNLWLVLARAGAFIACVMVFRLAARLTWRLRYPDVTDGRLAALAAPTLAGLVAAASLALSGGFLSASTLGYSEGLLVAAVLIAIERHLDGHRHQAFILGFVAALDRPEIWLFWGPYGLWLMWRDRSSRALVIGLALATLFLWFVPQKWGSGSFFSGVTRAHHPRSNSSAFASCPFCAELTDHAWPQVLVRLKAAAALTVLAALIGLGRGGWRLSGERLRAMALLVLFGVVGLGWWMLVALETQGGFSGNDRYLVLGSALIEITGGVGFGWAALAIGRWLDRHVAALRRGALASALACGMCALFFLLAPNWVGTNYISIARTHRSLLYQAHLRQDLAALIAHDGGARHVLACGTVMTEGFQVPMVAWYLGVHTLGVEAPPPVTPARPVAPPPWPHTIFQARDTSDAELLPLPATVIAWEHDGARYTFIHHRTMWFFQDCAKAAGA